MPPPRSAVRVLLCDFWGHDAGGREQGLDLVRVTRAGKGVGLSKTCIQGPALL